MRSRTACPQVIPLSDGKTQEFEITLIDEADLSGQTASTQQDSSSNNNGYTNPYGGYGYTIP